MAVKAKRRLIWEKTRLLLFAILAVVSDQLFDLVLSNFIQQTKVASFLSIPIYLTLTVNDIFFYAIALILFICFLFNLDYSRLTKPTKATTEPLVSLQDELTQLVVNSECFDSAQLYVCSISVTDQHIIKVKFVAGYAAEAVNLNSLVQGYYYFDHPVFVSISAFIRNFEAYQLAESNNKNIEPYIEPVMNSGLELMRIILDQLNGIVSPSEVQQNQCALYRIYLYVFSIVTNSRLTSKNNDTHNANDLISITSGLANKDVEDALRKTKKTGLVGVVFFKNVIFEDSSNAFEPNRTYYAKMFNINQVKYICLVSINSKSIFSFSNLTITCDEQLKQFEEILSKDTLHISL